MLYNATINLGAYIMPFQSELTILAGKNFPELDFGNVFNDCLAAFHSNGSYSEISHSGEKFLSNTISLEFCKIVKGTMFGHYPLYAPDFSGEVKFLRRSPFFHFSTLAEENIENANTALSITLDKDEHAQTLLSTIAICLIQKGYRAFINPDNRSIAHRVEVTKESVAKHFAKNTGLKH